MTRRLNPQQVFSLLHADHRDKVAKGVSRESPSNVGFTCLKHALQPGRFAGQEPAIFIGKHVQLNFPTGLDNPQNEKMWVRVKGMAEGDAARLVGTLDNHPVLAKEWAHGATVTFGVAEIVRVLDEADA